jgi:hypothetical protein
MATVPKGEPASNPFPLTRGDFIDEPKGGQAV